MLSNSEFFVSREEKEFAEKIGAIEISRYFYLSLSYPLLRMQNSHH